ncbi:MAG: ROK family protein, partial [Sinobacteraceae bacterium]|nr:ROK family protein [Nevskiaceae bacterium]
MLRIGIDLGGTKIAAVALDDNGHERGARGAATPQGDYTATILAVATLVQALETELRVADVPVGVGHPGVVSPVSGRVGNANSVCLNGQPLGRDLE